MVSEHMAEQARLPRAMRSVRTAVVVRACAGAAAVSMMAFPTSSAEYIFLGDFEHGDVPLTRENRSAPWYNSGNAPVVVTAPEPVRYGRHAMKTFLDRRQSSCSYRTEVVPRMKHFEIGKEYWLGLSILLPEDYLPDDIWEIVLQFHGSPDHDEGEHWRNPILFIYTTNGKWTVGNRWDAKRITQKKPSGKGSIYDGSKRYDLGPYQTGVWTDWVVHVKWSFKPDGILEVWKDETKVITQMGPNTFNDKNGPYLKMGLYKGWRDRQKPEGTVSRRVLYHDEVRITGADGSYEAVAPPGIRRTRAPQAKQRAPDPAAPARPRPTAEALASYDLLLQARLAAELACGGGPRVTLSAIGATATVREFDASGSLGVALDRSADTLTINWHRLSASEKASLATSVLHDDRPDDHELAAFWLLAAGRRVEAREHRARAKDSAAALEAAFK